MGDDVLTGGRSQWAMRKVKVDVVAGDRSKWATKRTVDEVPGRSQWAAMC